VIRHLVIALGLPVLALSATAYAAPAGVSGQEAVPAGIQLPFQPNEELLARLNTGSCWSEYRLYDPKTQVLGETLALEWYDKLDESVSRMYLRQDAEQKSFRRLRVTYRLTPKGALMTATGDEGPDRVGATWTATYAMPDGKVGSAVMRVIEGGDAADEHVSTGVLTLPGVFASAITVAHSAGCTRR
jgi:hypothetical protein